MIDEEWKPVAGWPLYEVSSCGRVRRLATVLRKSLVPITVLRSRPDKNGRMIVALRVGESGNKQKPKRVNTLVYQSFIGELPRKFKIEHIDGDLRNCRADNLRLGNSYIPEEDDMRWCGKIFGYWTVIGRDGKDKYGNATWKCRCVCGTEKRVQVGDLRRGCSRNCGCKNAELANNYGENNPAWLGGRSRDPETPGSFGWCCSKINAINHHAKVNGYAKIVSTAEEIAALWKKSDGVCAACGRPPKNERSLHLDHDHATGKARSFLCNHCNVAIGMAGDSSTMLRKLADYLDSHQSIVEVESDKQFDVRNLRISGGKVRAS